MNDLTNKATMTSLELFAMLDYKELKNLHQALNNMFKQEIKDCLEIKPTLRPNGSVDFYTLSKELADKFLTVKGYKGNMFYGVREHAALATIEQLLGITLIKQYPVLGFRVDGYDFDKNVCYEIDEPEHFKNGELLKKDKHRQKLIEEELGCTFIRIKV